MPWSRIGKSNFEYSIPAEGWKTRARALSVARRCSRCRPLERRIRRTIPNTKTENWIAEFELSVFPSILFPICAPPQSRRNRACACFERNVEFAECARSQELTRSHPMKPVPRGWRGGTKEIFTNSRRLTWSKHSKLWASLRRGNLRLSAWWDVSGVQLLQSSFTSLNFYNFSKYQDTSRYHFFIHLLMNFKCTLRYLYMYVLSFFTGKCQMVTCNHYEHVHVLKAKTTLQMIFRLRR